MKYDFTSIIDRTGSNAIAVDVIPFKDGKIKEGFSKIPMWIADMNFATAPAVTQAMIERINHPLFGYYITPDEYYDTIIRWHEERNGVTGLTKECIGYENGVLGGLMAALQTICSPGEAILLHSPTYVGFTNSMSNYGYKLIHSELVQDENGVWRMDYEDMDAKIKANKIHTAVFCSPHNPCGRVWERWEIEKAMEVYAANDCYVIADEIWSDLVLGDNKHIPTQSVSDWAREHVIAQYAPSKTFSLAGLIGSYHIIYNKALRERIEKQSSLCHYNSQNVLSMHALLGAYSAEGAEWLEELLQVLTANADYAYNYIVNNFKGVKLAKPEGTYMLYLDCEEWCKEHDKTLEDVIGAGISVGVIWQDGRPFHRPYAIRMNLAVPYSLLIEAFDRLDKYVFNA